MAIDNLQNFFFAKAAIKGNKLTPREFTLLVGIKLFDPHCSGKSIQAIQRYCEKVGHCWHYRTMVKLVDKLIAARVVSKTGRRIRLSPEGMLLINYVERKLKRVAVAAAA
jgi:hypothetical protein